MSFDSVKNFGSAFPTVIKTQLAVFAKLLNHYSQVMFLTKSKLSIVARRALSNKRSFSSAGRNIVRFAATNQRLAINNDNHDGRGHLPGSPVLRNSYNVNNPKDKEALRQLRKVEVIKGLIQGTGLLALLVAGFVLVNDYNYYRNKVKNIISGSGLASDDENGKNDGDVQGGMLVKKNEYIKFTTDVKDSKQVPGVYLWGSNADGVVNPEDLKTTNYKFPVRLSWFDGIVLKDLKINTKLEDYKDDLNMYLDSENEKKKEKFNKEVHSSAFAIDSKGQLIQWGRGFNEEDPSPKYTLKGHNLVKGEFSNNMIYLLNNKNEVLYIPVSSKLQSSLQNGNQQKSSSSIIPFIGGSKSKIPFVEKLDTSLLLKSSEKIKDFQTGINHLVLLTDKNKTYISSTGLDGVFHVEKNFGQFGLIEYSQFEDPPAPNKLHELYLLNNEIISKALNNASSLKKSSSNNTTKQFKVIPRDIVQIATGNYHTIARDSIGNIYSFGKNTFGQLGFQVSYNTENIPIPKKIDFFTSYFHRLNFYPIVTDIQASSNSSFVTLITKNIQEVFQQNYLGSNTTNIETDTNNEDNLYYFAFGKGLYGQLGIDHYVHANAVPKKLNALHSLTEFNETTNQLENITVRDWTIGKNHTFVTLLNTDVLSFGGNKFGQLGTGKLANRATPGPIPKLVESENLLKGERAMNVLSSNGKSPSSKKKEQVDVPGALVAEIASEQEKQVDNKASKTSDENNDLQVLNATKFIRRVNNRLALIENQQFKYKDNDGKNNTKQLSQVVVAGNDNSAIFYKLST